METLSTSFIVSGRGDVIKTMFDRPVSVRGKSIRVKSVKFPVPQHQPIRYKFLVKDSSGTTHTLSLPPKNWYWSEDILRAMYIVLCDLFESLDSRETYVIDEYGDVDATKPSKPRFVSSRTALPFTAIYYGDSGLKIVPDLSPQSVFLLLEERESRSNDKRLAYTPHVPYESTAQEVEHELDSTEAVYLFCDAIRPIYFGKTKRQILDVVKMSRDGNYFSNAWGEFHDFAVDVLMQISFYFQTMDGVVISFDDPVVVHFLIR